MKIPRKMYSTRKSGFALVATLSIMLLLFLLTVAMLSLTASSTRSQADGKARAEAEANAKLALRLAIGDLQKHMGPDQRISANGEILGDPTSTTTSVNHPHWTGAWDSWVTDPTEAPVNPDYPSSASHHQTIGSQPDDSMHPDYANKDRHFRKWLVSLDPTEAETITSANDLTLGGNLIPSSSDTAIRLVGEGSLGSGADSADFVSARLLTVADPSNSSVVSGRFAWWVGDQSQKVQIMDDSYAAQSSLTPAEHIFRSQAPGSAATDLIAGLENLTDESQLKTLPSRETLNLLSGVTGLPAQQNFHNATIYSRGVLADVRDGGLKRDLNTLLERPLSVNESGDEFMLYRFGNQGDDRVPIQDLAAYYQLYNDSPAWEGSGELGGIEHNAAASRVMQVTVPDYGDPNRKTQYTRQYTTLYRNPVPIKVQFVVGVGATRITQEERDFALSKGQAIRDSDKYKLLLGVKPVVSLWNPNNVPLVMGTDASQIMKVGFPPFVLRWKKYRGAGEYLANKYLNLNYAISNESTDDGRARSLGPYIMQIQFARNSPIVFEPGEVRMFSIPINESNFLESGGDTSFANRPLYQAEEFLPDGFYVTAKSAVRDGIDAPWLGPNNYRDKYLVFGDGDVIDFEVVPEAENPISRAVSRANEIWGSGFQFWMKDSGYPDNGTAHFRNYQFISRFGGTQRSSENPNFEFNNTLMLSGFPGGQAIPFEGETNALPGSEILAATANGEAKALLNFFMMAACEKQNLNAGGAGAGRRITARPFTHGSIISAPQITGNARPNLYDYSWEWQVNRINSLEEAFHDNGNSRGFYGGGYTIENGVTRVVQQYLPPLPAISIASLSSAHLGGFSLANTTAMSTPDASVNVGSAYGSGNIIRDSPNPGDWRQVTATGQGGLAPHVLQAVGNSYAHPNVPADKAFTTYIQLLNTDTDSSDPPTRAYADHSYLANKALWDDYFFSSISPQSSDIPLYGTPQDRSAVEVASSFFFDGELLPNHRMEPYTTNLTVDEFETLRSQYSAYAEGFADKIAAYMMVDGPFNINSTSVDAWKVFFSSLKGKPLAYLDNAGADLSTTTPQGTRAQPGMLANDEPIVSSELSDDANAPPQQWRTSRTITDEEIEQLAIAMVEQVKTRGPFLSLSEFINRRLDATDTQLALKSAIQAALDDESVTINEAFRTSSRTLDGELGTMSAAFSEALSGPIAYGSTPYVDQADILRHLGNLMTPRGDTFVIRTYGDSLDQQGNVVARAWCEAVVQRVPDYLVGTDEAYLKQSELEAEPNKNHGRRFKIIGFRWLNSNEV